MDHNCKMVSAQVTSPSSTGKTGNDLLQSQRESDVWIKLVSVTGQVSNILDRVHWFRFVAILIITVMISFLFLILQCRFNVCLAFKLKF